ncbi:phage scaffolding protein, partial [Clostridium perfringens]
YQAELKDLKLTNAIKLTIADSAQDVDLVSSLIDKSKLILADDGKVTGLDEQVTSLKENKSFLFKAEENNNPGNQIQFTKKITGN